MWMINCLNLNLGKLWVIIKENIISFCNLCLIGFMYKEIKEFYVNFSSYSEQSDKWVEN